MKITTLDLKSRNYGVVQGSFNNDKRCCCMSQPIIIEYIDIYFGGELEVGLNGNDIMYGSAKFSKFDIDDKFFNKFIKYLSESVDYPVIKYLKDISKELNIKYKNIVNNKINNIDSKRLICYVFERLLYSFGCNLDIKINNNLNDFIEFESY